LDVSINSDGTIDLSSSPELIDLSTSSTKGTEASPDDDPRGRFDRSDFEFYDARQPFVGGRFTPFAGTGPSAGFPEEDLDAGIAARFADYGAYAEFNGVGPISSPQRPAASGLVAGGGATPITAPGGNERIRVDGSGATAVFNIDGYLFRIREQIDIDFALASFTNLAYLWVYVERVGANYGGANFLYNQDAGYAAKDLRILQNGTAGETSTSTFSDAAALFNSAVLGKVRAGDVLVIDDTGAAGKYVIDSVDSDTQVTIRGEFKADVSGADWHVQDDHHPNVGLAEGGSDPEDLPLYVPGRVYIGRVRNVSGGVPVEVVTFAKGGVFDSGWVSVDAGNFGGGYTLPHELGVPPTSVQVFLREAINEPVYGPYIVRSIVTDVDPSGLADPVIGNFKFNDMLFPSMFWESTTRDISFYLQNAQPGNVTPVGAALFSVVGGTPVGELGSPVEMRVVCKR
jgi:hypothetical protein